MTDFRGANMIESEQRDRIAAKDTELAALRERVKELEAISGLGCDARDGGPHSVMAQGANYKFCTACGETIRTPALRERARIAEARAETAERKLAEARGGLTAAIRAAKLAVFTINKQGVMPNSSWESGFNADLKTAEDAARAITGKD